MRNQLWCVPGFHRWFPPLYESQIGKYATINLLATPIAPPMIDASASISIGAGIIINGPATAPYTASQRPAFFCSTVTKTSPTSPPINTPASHGILINSVGTPTPSPITAPRSIQVAMVVHDRPNNASYADQSILRCIGALYCKCQLRDCSLLEDFRLPIRLAPISFSLGNRS